MLFRKLTISSLANVSGQIATGISVFIVSPMLIAGLGLADYGLWLLALSVVGYLELLDLGISGTAMRFLSTATGSGEEARFAALFKWFRGYYRRAGAGIMLTGGAIALAGGLLPILQAWRGPLLLIAGLTAVLGCAFSFRVYAAVLRAHLDYHFITFSSIVRVSLYTVIIFTFSQQINLFQLLALHAALTILEHSAIYLFARKHLTRKTAIHSLDSRDLKAIRAHAGKNVATGVSNSLRWRIDTQILAAFVSLPTVTQYGVGLRVPQMFFDLLVAMFGSQFIAAFSRTSVSRSREENHRLIHVTIQICAAASITGAIILFFLAPPFIERWLGPGFDEAKVITRILLPAWALVGTQIPFHSYLIAASRHGRVVVLTLVTATINLILSFALVRPYGSIGVVSATAFEFVLNVVVVPGIAAPVIGWTLWTCWKTTIVRPLVVYSLLAAPLCAMISQWMRPESYFDLVLTALLMGGVLAAVSWWVFFDRQTRSKLLEVTKKYWPKSV